MSIGSITPTALILAALGTGQATGSPSAAAGSDPGLFTALLKSELETVAGELQAATGGATGTSHAEIALAPAVAPTSGAGGSGSEMLAPATSGHGSTQASPPASSTAVAGASSAPAPAAAAPSTPVPSTPAPASTATTATGAAAPQSPPSSIPSTDGYVVTYIHGATPVSTGPAPAPLVKGPTGHLVLTAKTTGLTQLTPRFTGTVAHPTAAAQATPSVMASIAYLRAHGQA